MAEYTFDGKQFRRSQDNTLMGEIDGNYIRDANYSQKGQIDGNYIRDASYNIIAQVDGDYIRDANNNQIGTVYNVQNIIDGPGGPSLVALWVLFIR
jgi:hypothetical protein